MLSVSSVCHAAPFLIALALLLLIMPLLPGRREMAAWQMRSACPRDRLGPTLLPTRGAMNHDDDKPADHLPSAAMRHWVQNLHDLEMYLTKRGGSDFVYDEELDVFRFPEDGRFAFCREFADWGLLAERGYIDL